jgi:hypothetical protein
MDIDLRWKCPKCGNKSEYKLLIEGGRVIEKECRICGFPIVGDKTIMEGIARLSGAQMIQNIIDNPDELYSGEDTPPQRLLDYLERTGCPIPKNGTVRKDVVKLMVRYWATREALFTIKELYG